MINNILYDLHHGFRSSRSCEAQLVSFIQDLAKSSDKNIQTDLIIMDFAKAFNKVLHKHLMYKISYCNAFHWVKDFLTDRTQTVTLLTVCCENQTKVGKVAFPESERRQERRFNRKGVVMNIHRNIGASTVP
jgi:hypothetical protein